MDMYTVDDFKTNFPDQWDYVPETKNAKYIYVSKNEECPYIGIEYIDGSIWVYGAKKDCKVCYEELEWYLEEV